MSEQRIKTFVKSTAKNGIAQHTPEWLCAKKTTVGGSTLAAVIGCNPYDSDWVKSIMTRVGHLPFSGGKIKCSWGNLFEDIIKLYVEDYYKTTVHGDNIFYYVADGILAKRIAYSPDGLCVIDNDLLRKKYRGRCEGIDKLTSGQSSNVLLEFKAPFSRRVDESIPEYYLPQPLMGMDVLRDKDGRLCDISLFIEAIFRLCKYEDVDEGRLHSSYPSNFPRSDADGNYHSIGMIIVYGPRKHKIADVIVDEFEDGLNVNNDLVLLSADKDGSMTINDIIVALDDGPLIGLHTGPCADKKELKKKRRALLKDPSASCVSQSHDIDGLVPYGSFFWKLLEFKAKPVFPVDGYVMSHGDKITEYTNYCRAVVDMSYEDAESYLIERID
jgi:hypothetical protein